MKLGLGASIQDVRDCDDRGTREGALLSGGREEAVGEGKDDLGRGHLPEQGLRGKNGPGGHGVRG